MEEGERNNKIKSLENWQRELAEMHRQKADVAKRVEIHKKKVALMEKNFKIILDNFEYLKPNWKYEEQPEYIENLKKLNLITQDENRLNWQAQIDGAERNTKAVDEQIESLSSHIKKLEEELNKNE